MLSCIEALKRFHHGHALAMQHNPPSRCASSRPPAVHSCIPSRGLRAFTHQHHTIIRGHSHRRPAAFAAQDVRVRPSLPVARPRSSRRSHPRPPCGCSQAERSTFSFLASQWTGHPCAIERRRDALLPASFGGTVLLARFALHQTRHNSDSIRLESRAKLRPLSAVPLGKRRRQLVWAKCPRHGLLAHRTLICPFRTTPGHRNLPTPS